MTYGETNKRMRSSPRKRYRPSSIDLLPKNVRESLKNLSRDPSLTQEAITDRINDLLENIDSDVRVSKSAINRYFQRHREELGDSRAGLITQIRDQIAFITALLDQLEGYSTSD